MRYNKLVRDKIPEIIRRDKAIPITHTADEEEYRQKLKEKLKEEVDKFIKSKEEKELADILEVLNAICDLKGIDKESLEIIKKKRFEERGGFNKRIILEGTKKE